MMSKTDVDHPPTIDRDVLLRHLGDPAANGMFVVAVRTTGIYCLPGCRPPRPPKPENVVGYATTNEAVVAGYRACKLCRPDDWYRDREG